jgi:DNA primase
MAVDQETFLNWAKNRFGEENIKIRHSAHGDEILTHSFYAHRNGIEDYTFNLWMNPSGGKAKNPEKGSFRCWKTDNKGSLVKLVADFDSMPYDEAEEFLCGATSLRRLEQRVHEFFDHKEEIETAIPIDEPKKVLSLPDFTFLIDRLSPTHFIRAKARKYLSERKIPTDGLYVCTGGDYKDRIIIPYYDAEADLIWYNGRLMQDKKGVIKYMKCKSDGLNVTQEDVLYMTSWPAPGSKIYLMEGEIDALSMKLCGFFACGLGGKSISDTQVQLLRPYVPVLAFDADQGFKKDSGLRAMIDVGTKLLESGFPKVFYVRPPKFYKDWNKLLVEKDEDTVRNYVSHHEKQFTEMTKSVLLSNNV